jgi:hypothetical protein
MHDATTFRLFKGNQLEGALCSLIFAKENHKGKSSRRRRK